MGYYDRVAELPIEIDGYELDERDVTFPSGFERPSTLITLRGGGTEGIGEDVVYDGLDHIAHRDRGAVEDLTGPGTLGELCELIGSLDLFAGAPPVRDFSRRYRRWAYESAALDLALRQAGKPLGEVLDRELQPLNFVCSVRLNPVEESDGNDEVLAPLTKRLDKYPSLSFKLDPQADWDHAVVAFLVDSGAVDSLDMKGCYSGTPVDVDLSADDYARLLETFPDAWIEDPKLNDETMGILEPHRNRITWDSPIHSIADIETLRWKPKVINIKPSRIGGLEDLFAAYEYCEREEIGAYGGGQTELDVGRDHIQYMAALMHPDTPNDVAPRGYNETDPPEGLPISPLEIDPAPSGFRFA